MSNNAHEAIPAIAAFMAIQLAFVSLVKKGILSKAEAEEILREAIESIKTTRETGVQAAELLTEVLERLSKFQPSPGQ